MREMNNMKELQKKPVEPKKCEVCGRKTVRKGKVTLCLEHKEFKSYSGFNQ